METWEVAVTTLLYLHHKQLYLICIIFPFSDFRTQFQQCCKHSQSHNRHHPRKPRQPSYVHRHASYMQASMGAMY